MQVTATLDAALMQVHEALRSAHSDAALAMTSELLSAYPESIRVWRARGAALAAAGQFDAAAEAYTRVLDVSPSDSEALAACAATLAAASRGLEAADVARHALDHTPDSAQLRDIARLDTQVAPAHTGTQFGTIAFARGQYDAGLFNRALAKVRALVQAQPTRADARMVLADMLWRGSIRHVAGEVCADLLASHPNALGAHAMLLALARRKGDAQSERRHTQAIARFDPDHRETTALFGEHSPLAVSEAPVNIPQQLKLVEDDETRSDWVDQLIASSSAAPAIAARKTSQPSATAAVEAEALDPREGTAITELPPLNWTHEDEGAEALLAGVDDDLDDPSDDASDLDDERITESALRPHDSPAADTTARDAKPARPRIVTDEGIEVEALDWSQIADDDLDDASDADSMRFRAQRHANATVAPDQETAHQRLTAIAQDDVLETDGDDDGSDAGIEIDVDGEASDDEPPIRNTPNIQPAARRPFKATETSSALGGTPEFIKHGERMIRVDTMKPSATGPASVPAAARGKPDDLLSAARSALAAEQMDEAGGYFEQLIQKSKRLDEVVDDLEAAALLHGDSQRIHELLGMAHTRKGNITAAIEAYRKALACTARRR
jgi:tetratricopeptide (TPR) repeat protein